MRSLATSTVAARCYNCRISLELFAAGDVMTSPVITMTTRQSVYLLARVLVASSHSGFPVVQIDPHTGHESVYGLITRYIRATQPSVHTGPDLRSISCRLPCTDSSLCRQRLQHSIAPIAVKRYVAYTSFYLKHQRQRARATDMPVKSSTVNMNMHVTQ